MIMRKFLFKVLVVLFVFGVWTEGFGQDFEWAKSIGSEVVGADLLDKGIAVTTDFEGNVYTIGCFTGEVDFDPGIDSFKLTSYLYNPLLPNGNYNCSYYIQKLNSNGDFIWVKSLTTGVFSSFKIKDDFIYLTGNFFGTEDFDLGTGNFNLTTVGAGSCFILKLNLDGGFVWAKNIGNTSIGHDIDVDKNDNILISGLCSNNPDFDPGLGVFNLGSGSKFFVLKLTNNGDFVWVKGFDGLDTYQSLTGKSILSDNSGNIYVTGVFEGSVDFDPSFSTNVLSVTNPSEDGFIVKLDSIGNFLWAKQIQSTTDVKANSIAIDSKENIYITGGLRIPGGSTSVFYLYKYDENGNPLWTKYLNSIRSWGTSMEIDLNDNIHIIGLYFYNQLNIPSQTSLPSASGHNNIFILKIDSNEIYTWARGVQNLGYLYNDPDIAFDKTTGSLYITGGFSDSADFNPSFGTNYLTTSGYTDLDAFIFKLSQCVTTVTELDTAVCNTYTTPSGNMTFSSEGNYLIYDTLSRVCSVDSILEINLSINKTTSTDTQSAPSPFTWIDGNTYTTNNTSATDTLINSAGCDSVVTLNLTIIDTIIQGNIMTSLGNPLQNSKVYLIHYFASQDSVFAMDSTFTDAVGFYEFPNTFQNAYVKAVPDDTNYPNEVPTYNVSSAVFQNADAVYLSFPFGNTDFSTIAGVNPGGNGFIGGIVGNGAGKNSEVGQLLPNISLVLVNTTNEAVGQTLTNINGHFEFANLAEETYSIWVDKAGILNNLAPSISLEADNNQDDLKFVLHKTYLENITTVGLENITNSNFGIFPNPTNKIITIQNSEVAQKYSVELYSVLGEQVYVKTSKKESLNIDLEKLNLSKGTYFVKIATEKGSFVSKVVYR